MSEFTYDPAVTTPRKGKYDGPVGELSAFFKVKPGHEEAIAKVLNNLTPEQKEANMKAISTFGTLHQARYVLFDNGTRLLVGTTFDGDWDVYIDDFSTSAVLDGWDSFFIHIEGYPDEGKDAAGMSVHEIKEFLTHNQVTASDFLMVYPGTVQEIQKAQRVQTAFQQVLDNPDAAEALQHPALKPLLTEAAD